LVSRRSWAGWALLALLLLVAVNAVYGGMGLIRNGMGMSTDWLTPTPFDSWLVPGLALMLTVAVPQLIAAGLVLVRSRRAAAGGLVVGIGLMLWIVVQLAVLRRYFFLQPVIFGMGAVEAALALRWLATDHAPARTRPHRQEALR
jgi:hypothetical protein